MKTKIENVTTTEIMAILPETLASFLVKSNGASPSPKTTRMNYLKV